MPQINLEQGANIKVAINRGPLSGGTPTGNIGELQFNKDGQRFGTVATATYDATNNQLKVTNLQVSGGSQGEYLINTGGGNVGWGPVNAIGSLTGVSASNDAVDTTVNGVIISQASPTGLEVTGNILPTANITYDLGSPTQRWRDIYLSNSTIDLNGVRLSADGTDFVVQGGMLLQGGIVAREFYGNISGDYLSGDGSRITNISANAVVGSVATSIVSGVADTVRESAQPNITSVGNLTSLVVSGKTNLGPIANLKLTGGHQNDVVLTDGQGNLSFGQLTVSTIANSGTHVDAKILSANITVANVAVAGFNTTKATFNVPVDVTGNINATGNLTANKATVNAISTANLTATGKTSLGVVSNVSITGGSSDQFLMTDGLGNINFSDPYKLVSGGTSVIAQSNNWVNFTIAGIANVLQVRETGLQMSNDANSNMGNVVRANYFIGEYITGDKFDLGHVSDITVDGGAPHQFLRASNTAGKLEFYSLDETKISNGSSNVATYQTKVEVSANNVANILYVTSNGTNGVVGVVGNLEVGGLAHMNSANINGAMEVVGDLSAFANVNLGSIANLRILGGTNEFVLTTDGNANLSWTSKVPSSVSAETANIANVAYSVDAANVVGLDLVVGNAISALVDGAPDALNTLSELANALANDASYSTTIVNSLANKVEFTTFQDYTVITDATIANLATSANLQTLADSTANALANKVETTDFQSYVDTTANTIANLVTTDTFTTYQGDTANTIANLATISYVDTTVSNAVANVLGGAPEVLDTLSELANALGNDASFITTITSGLANKVDTTTYDLFVSDTGNTIANLVTTDTFTTYQSDLANVIANTASWQELEDGLANKVYSNVFNDTVANLVGITTFNDTVANLATITYVDDSIANIPPTDLSAYSTTTEVNGLISTALSGHGNIVSVNLSGNTSQLLAGDGTWIDRITLSGANAVSISVTANGAGQSFQDNEFIHYTGNVKPMLFKNGVFVDLGEYSIASNSITFTNNLTVGDQIDVMPTQIAVVSGGSTTPVDLSNYATHQDVADAINLIPSPNLDAYATNVSVDNKIANITFPTYGNVANINLNGNASTYLAGNGTWQAVSGGGTTSPAGVNTQLQFNNNGAFGASANLTFVDNGLVIGNITSTKITLNKFGAIDAKTVNARDGFTTTIASAGELTVNRLIAPLTDAVPTSSSDFGTFGEIRYDSNFLYICVAENTWSRTPLNTTW